MRLISRMALGVALACGGAAMVAAPAGAKKEEKAAPLVLGDKIRAQLLIAQNALNANDGATAQATLIAAIPLASNPDEKLYTGQLLYKAGGLTKDVKAQTQGLDLWIASGKVPADQLNQINLARANIAYGSQDYRAAEPALQSVVKAGGADVNTYAMLAETQAKLGKPADALATLQSASDAFKAQGKPLPADFYGRAISIGYNAKLVQPVNRLTLDWLAAYPTVDNWRDSLVIYRELNHVDADTDLDVSRLQRSVGALKGEKDYYDYASAIYLRYPGEAQAVIQEGISKGFLNGAAGGDIQQMLTTVNKRVAADKADLPGAATAAGKAATGKPAFVTADAYLGYGDYAKAIPLYRTALAKGGVDANIINTRLGMALARSGDKAGAKAAFGAVTGTRAQLAQYWMVWIDKQA